MFSDRTDRLADNNSFMGYGAAVTPGQEGPLVFVTGHGEANRLLRWEDGQLVDRSCGVLADTSREAIGIAAADMDADGLEEVYIHNTDSYDGETETTDLLLDRIDHEGRTVWCDIFGEQPNVDRGNQYAGRSVAAVDRLGTGRYGMVVASYGAALRYYELGDDREITDMAAVVGLECDCYCRSLVAAPLVSESMDLFVGTDDGPNRLFRNDDGHFVEVAGEHGLDDTMCDCRGAVAVDDGDGLGIATVGWESQNRIFSQQYGDFVDVAPESFAESTAARTLLAADFDNDGRQELFVNALGEPHRLFGRRGGSWQQLDVGDALEVDGCGTGGVVADLDSDGQLELLVVHGEREAQPLSLYTAPTDNSWLRVAPTTQYGAPARGAVVTLETDQSRQRRVVDAASGYLCQSEPVAHFGLGGKTTPRLEPQAVTVRWPDGRERTVESPARETTHRMGHPAADPE